MIKHILVQDDEDDDVFESGTPTTPGPPSSPSVRRPTSKSFPPPTAFSSSTYADRPTWVASLSPPRRGRGYGLSAASGRRRGGQREADDVPDDDEDDGWEEEEEPGDEPLMPLEEMARWLENKPAGFGEGKTYDTTLEEQLLKEMESRKAQLANINKLKNEAKSAATARPKKQEPRRKEIDVIPSAAHVCMWNLPRKKNIHRDLCLAFKGFSGIVDIIPAVSGNQKTSYASCKGFAFLDFESEEAANRFVRKYSNTHVLFGKAQKQISCAVINSRGSSSTSEQSVDGIQTFSQLKVTALGVEDPTLSDMTKHSQNSWAETIDIAVVDKPRQESLLMENGTYGPLVSLRSDRS